MGLIAVVVHLSLVPLRGGVWLAELLEQQAARLWSDPLTARNEITALAHLREGGAIDAAQARVREAELTQRLVATAPEA